MHITELRIAGFKSFVEAQEIPIQPGLTGIVGPNGCGKSNLLEALRWAMGASSARAMRGGEMDDLIFSGSADRPARELAEVTLVLDNSARTAPADFNTTDELEIVRRLKRGAGSTYKLNGRTVRGKDIQLIFADASTGANSPSLVRQGQISELIAAKPQNRRRILEEAAGISGLNTRRHEAELKLRAAETNLERLSEVSAEVERQLESLKRQARKARKYKALSVEIDALGALVAHLRWSAARTAHEEAEAVLSEARRAVETATREAATTETVRIEAEAELQPLRDAESVASGRLGQARIELARLEAERKNAAERVERLEGEARRLASDIEREQAQKDDAEAALGQTRADLDALPEADSDAFETREADAARALETAQLQLTDAEAAADDANSRLAGLRAEHQAAQARLAAQARRREAIERDVAKARRDLDALPDTVAIQSDLDAARAAHEAAVAALTEAKQASDAADLAVEQAREAERTAQPRRDTADRDVRTLSSEIAGLERLLRKAADHDAPPVIQALRTQTGLEIAVAAALGDDLQAPADPGAPVYWSLQASPDQPLPTGAVPLSEHVSGPEELAARLSQCGLVEADAGAQLATSLKPGQRLVSREGHLWRWDGYTRTPDAPAPAAERLAQQTRLEALQARIAPAQETLGEAERALDTARKTLGESEAAAKAARSNVSETTAKLSATERRLRDVEQSAEKAGFRREAGETALSSAEQDLAALDAEYEDAGPAVSPEDIETAQSALDAAREGLRSTREAETEARGALAAIRQQRTQAAERRAALERDVARWSDRFAKSESRLEELITRRRDAASEAGKARETPERLASELETLSARVEALEADRKSAADRLAEREAAHREGDRAARDAASAATQAREALAGAKVRLETAEARLEEAVSHALTTFQRKPEGLMALARAGLEDDAIDSLDASQASGDLERLKRERDQLGGVNMDAEAEAEELADRLGHQAEEKDDLVKAIAKLREGVDALNAEGRARLLEAFEQVNTHFRSLFTTLFRGGEAELRLVDADDPLAAGLEIMAQPPGKRLGTLSLMSGGEQALTATALIFAVFLSRPAPICVLDEVDAPLDDANVDRYCRMLDEMRRRTDTRFIVITHNPVTMSRMDRLFGVTMREKGVSKLVSVNLDKAEELVAAE